MKNDFVRKAISIDLDKQIEQLRKNIKDTFGITLSKIQASKVIAWKSSTYNLKLSEKKLLQILGNRLNEIK